MSNAYVLVGLPASGKSTLSKKLEIQHEAITLSSDSIREELYGDESVQGNNNEVFELLYIRANKLLAEGENIIIDATNINRKRRIHLIKNVLKADKYVCYYMTTPIYHCVYNDSNRKRSVGYSVLSKMYKNMQIPIKNEGFDNVIYYHKEMPLHTSLYDRFIELVESNNDHDYLFSTLGKFISEFDDIYNSPHDSKYHSFSVSRHTYYVYKYIMDNYKVDNRKFMMLVTSLFHDIGKAYCKEFSNMKGEETYYAHYYGHEFVSSQIAYDILYNLGFSEDFITYVTTLIQLHMIPHNMSDKQEIKLKELLTDEQFEDLMFLHEADMKAK